MKAANIERKAKKSSEDRLRAIVGKAYAKSSEEVRVRPTWLATKAMDELDPNKKAPELVRLAAHFQLRQIARSFCRVHIEQGKQDETAGEHQLFPGLQIRYPAAGAAYEPEYVLLEHLSEEDVQYNADRLRREGSAKLKHADALEHWWREQQAA